MSKNHCPSLKSGTRRWIDFWRFVVEQTGSSLLAFRTTYSNLYLTFPNLEAYLIMDNYLSSEFGNLGLSSTAREWRPPGAQQQQQQSRSHGQSQPMPSEQRPQQQQAPPNSAAQSKSNEWQSQEDETELNYSVKEFVPGHGWSTQGNNCFEYGSSQYLVFSKAILYFNLTIFVFFLQPKMTLHIILQYIIHTYDSFIENITRPYHAKTHHCALHGRSSPCSSRTKR